MVAAAEGRTTVSGRVLRPDGTPQEIEIVAVPDFNKLTVDAFAPLSGVYPPGRREVVVEGASFDVLQARLGDEITVELEQRRNSHAYGSLGPFTTGSASAPNWPAPLRLTSLPKPSRALATLRRTPKCSFEPPILLTTRRTSSPLWMTSRSSSRILAAMCSAAR